MARFRSDFAVGHPRLPFSGEVYKSAARTATPSVATQDDTNATNALEDQGNLGARGAVFVVDVTAIGAAPSVVFNIEGKDPTSGKYYLILASAAVVAVGTTVLRVYPTIPAVANLTAQDLLPEVWRVRPVHANTDSITYSVGAILCP